MAQEIITVIKKADDLALLTLYEARLGLHLTTSTDETVDDLLEMLIDWSSDEIALNCARTFGKETVTDNIVELISSRQRIYLSHYPIVSIDSIVENGTPLNVNQDYLVETDSGILTRINKEWMVPVMVSYTGGYELPNEAPKALKQAAILMTREAYFASIRGDASIKMLAHKESRVSYFDPNRMISGSMTSAGSPARKAVEAILQAYTRILC